MTNNKGSAAWMAPEVFEGKYEWHSKYLKCFRYLPCQKCADVSSSSVISRVSTVQWTTQLCFVTFYLNGSWVFPAWRHYFLIHCQLPHSPTLSSPTYGEKMNGGVLMTLFPLGDESVEFVFSVCQEPNVFLHNETCSWLGVRRKDELSPSCCLVFGGRLQDSRLQLNNSLLPSVWTLSN